MTTLREAAQEFIADYDCGGCGHFAAYAERFRKLLAQQEQEPAIYPAEAREMGLEEVAFYTHPPRREWCSLSEEEIIDAVRESDLDWQRGWTLEDSEPNRYTQLARAVEQALKEKNT